jgi:branched-chain amino acid aminotransferase
VGISRYIRFHPQSVVPGAKISGFYATSVLASIDARNRGFNECILLDHEGRVAEGPGENIFLVKKGKLYTPDSPSILPGITRDSIMTIARAMSIPVLEKHITKKELMSADEVFFTGTAVEIAAIGEIDHRKIGTGKAGPITIALRKAYMDATHGRTPRYRHWFTPTTGRVI